MCKNNKDALHEILKGKIVISGRDMYITTDIHKPKEFIYIPLDTEIYQKYAVHGIKKAVDIPDAEGNVSLHKKCIVFNNAQLEIVTKDDFTWLEGANTWAFFRKKVDNNLSI